MSDPLDLTATEALDGFRDRTLDPVELVAACLDRMDALDDRFHAFVARSNDSARAAAEESAERWRTGRARPLEGVPFGVKDIIETAGVRTAAGSPLFADHVPDTNATVVTRLEQAGAIMVGKTTTPEFAFGDETGDGVLNPWAADRWTGGSSSGSAVALASRQVPMALGTDTGGSIRVPSSYCGISGLKPTFGRVPRDGVFGVSWTLDHTGPMARSVADLALMLSVLAGRSPGDSSSSARRVPDYPLVAAGDATAIRIGVPDGWLESGCSPDVIAARDSALATFESLGADIEPVSVPTAELAGTIAWLITVVEFASHHDDRLDRVEEFSPSAAQRLVAGASTSARDYLKALRARHRIQQEFDAIFERVDAVVTASTPTVAPDMATFFDDGDRLWLDKVARHFLIFNVTGMPALVLPAGMHDGLPTSIQIAAAPHADGLCLRLGAAFQSATDHHRQAPAVI